MTATVAKAWRGAAATRRATNLSDLSECHFLKSLLQSVQMAGALGFHDLRGSSDFTQQSGLVLVGCARQLSHRPQSMVKIDRHSAGAANHPNERAKVKLLAFRSRGLSDCILGPFASRVRRWGWRRRMARSRQAGVSRKHGDDICARLRSSPVADAHTDHTILLRRVRSARPTLPRDRIVISTRSSTLHGNF